MDLYRECETDDARGAPPSGDEESENPQLELDPFDLALDLEVKALVAGATLDDLKYGRLSVLDIDLMYQAKLEEMYLFARPQIDAMMSQISAKSLAEAHDGSPLPDDPGEAAKEEARRAKDKRLEEIGAPLKAELERRIHTRFMSDIRRARHVRQYGWPGQAKRLEPISGVSPEIAREVCGLAKAGKLSAFSVFWSQVGGEEYARLKATGGIVDEQEG